MPKKKEIEVIDRGGAKTVAKKTSVVTHARRIFLIVSVLWLAFVVWFPLHVKNKYSDSIKQSTVVAIFYDLQRNVAEQYERMLNGIKNAINLEKPVAFAIDKVKMVETQVNKVTDTTAKAKEQTAKVKEQTSGVRGLTGLANKFGVKTDAIDNVLDTADGAVDKANAAVDKVDNVAKMVNEKLDGVEKELTRSHYHHLIKTIGIIYQLYFYWLLKVVHINVEGTVAYIFHSEGERSLYFRLQ